MFVVFALFFVVTCFRLLRAQQTNNKISIRAFSSTGIYFGVTAVFYFFFLREHPNGYASAGLQSRGAFKVLFDVISAPCVLWLWIYQFFGNKRRMKKEHQISKAIQMYGERSGEL